MVKRVNKNMLRLKLHYLLHGMGGAPVVPFGSLVGKQLGVTPDGMGCIFAVIPLLGIFLKPFLSGIADRHGMKKKIMMMLICISTLCYYTLQYLPAVPGPPSTLATCNGNKVTISVDSDPCLPGKLKRLYTNRTVVCELQMQLPESQDTFSVKRYEDDFLVSEIRLQPGLGRENGKFVDIPLTQDSVVQPCDTTRNFPIKVDCAEDINLSRLINHQKSRDVWIYGKAEFWMFLFVLTAAVLTFGSGCTFQESICHEICDQSGGAHGYGKQRLWASVGWGSMAVVAGYLMDRNSEHSLLYDYSIAFKIMFICWFMDLLVVYRLRVPEHAGKSRNPWLEVWSLLSQARVLVFLLWAVLVGAAFGVMGLQFWLLEDLNSGDTCEETQSLKILQGLCLTVNCIGEIPVFFLSGRMLARIGGSGSMVFVLLAHGVRLLYVSTLTSPWQTLPIELMQGLTFGIFFPCLVDMAAKIAPAGAETTMTALAFVCFDGIGSSVGGWSAGQLYKSVGGLETFRLYGLFSFLSAALISLLLYKIKPTNQKSGLVQRT